jgi:hypothetical protein
MEMKEFYQELKTKYGYFSWMGDEFVLLQKPYISEEPEQYEAFAVNLIMLERSNCKPEEYDPSINISCTALWHAEDIDTSYIEACEWDVPSSVAYDFM